MLPISLRKMKQSEQNAQSFQYLLPPTNLCTRILSFQPVWGNPTCSPAPIPSHCSPLSQFTANFNNHGFSLCWNTPITYKHAVIYPLVKKETKQQTNTQTETHQNFFWFQCSFSHQEIPLPGFHTVSLELPRLAFFNSSSTLLHSLRYTQNHSDTPRTAPVKLPSLSAHHHLYFTKRPTSHLTRDLQQDWPSWPLAPCSQKYVLHLASLYHTLVFFFHPKACFSANSGSFDNSFSFPLSLNRLSPQIFLCVLLLPR